PAPRSFRPRDPTPRSSAPVEVPTALRVLHRTAEQHPPYLSTTSRRWISLRGGVLPAWIPSALVGWDARFCGGRRAGFHGQGREARCRRGPDGDGDVHVDGGLVSAHPHRRLLGNGLRHVLAYSVEGLAPSRGAGAAPGRVRARELDGRGLQAPQRDRGDQDERGERHGDLRRGRPPIPQPARLRAFSMICKSSCFTWELVTILKSRPANAAAAMVPTAYSAVDIPRSPRMPGHRRFTLWIARIGLLPLVVMSRGCRALTAVDG